MSNSNSSGNTSFFVSPDLQGRVINDDVTYKIMLTNARSLSPKILSLHEYFEEHELHVAMVTESWLKDGAVLNRDVVDMEYGTNLKIIYKNRPGRGVGARRVGGGVSIIYNKSKCSLRERKIAGNKYELVAAVGNIGRSKRQVAFFCLYVEPRTRVHELEQLCDLISNDILDLKAKSNPIIFLGGDLNRRSLSGAVQAFPDIVQINNEPTRLNACLDVLLSNAEGLSSMVWPPWPLRRASLAIILVLSFQEQYPRPRTSPGSRRLPGDTPTRQLGPSVLLWHKLTGTACFPLTWGLMRWSERSRTTLAS